MRIYTLEMTPVQVTATEFQSLTLHSGRWCSGYPNWGKNFKIPDLWNDADLTR